MKKIILMTAFFFLFSPAAFGQERGASIKEGFSLANLAFVDGRHDEAVLGYLDIIERGMVNPDVYYNLGNAYLKTGETGKALLYYEKSLELSGGDDDIKYNMALAKEVLALPEERVDAASLIEKAGRFFSFKGSADLALLFYGITFSLFIAGIFASEGGKKKVRTAGYLFAALTLFTGVTALSKLYGQERAENAVVVVKKAGLHEVPLDSDVPGLFLREGMKVRVDEVEKRWLKISAPGGQGGWIKRSAAEII